MFHCNLYSNQLNSITLESLRGRLNSERYDCSHLVSDHYLVPAEESRRPLVTLPRVVMASLQDLKRALRQAVRESTPLLNHYQLTDEQYAAGFDTLINGPGGLVYQGFVVPQLSSILESHPHIFVLEVGPGPKSIITNLSYKARGKISRYVAFEPNEVFAGRLEKHLGSNGSTNRPLPFLGNPPEIYRKPFTLDSMTETATAGVSDEEKFDLILFCHSMYGMRPKRKFIEHALGKLTDDGIIVVFHRAGVLQLDGLVCSQTASYPTGVVRVADDDVALDHFARFIAGLSLRDVGQDMVICAKWREVCRTLGRRERSSDHLVFSAPDIMVAFTKNATALSELSTKISSMKEPGRIIKNQLARTHRAASIVRPDNIQQVQECVRWALKYKLGLTVVGGSHSGQCLWPNVVAVDMSAFDQVHTLQSSAQDGVELDTQPLLVVESGCNTGDVIRKAMKAGVTVPLGARPSVGAGLWLQGGIGHLARLHGLACDSIVGAVVVSVESGQVLRVGRVPSQYCPAIAIRPENESDILWAIKGAGSNFGIVVSVTFKAYPSPTYLVRNWQFPMNDGAELRLKLGSFNQNIAAKLPRNCSTDAFLYWDNQQLHLGVTMFECSTADALHHKLPLDTILGPESSIKSVDSVGLFDAEMYISGMHGGHGSGKTSSFKRCIFLKEVGDMKTLDTLVGALETRPSPLSYLHLLQGGGAIADASDDTAAFGCRDWDFACVITGVWPRNQEGSKMAQDAVEWVYEVSRTLLPFSCGAYGADLGPDPQDAALATRAFGQNLGRLARLKRIFDPQNVLAYACPIHDTQCKQKVIILVTGQSCAGKDYCAEIWASLLASRVHENFKVRVVSISDATKREYAAASNADFDRLLRDRAYKEQHRPALTDFFHRQVQKRSRLPQEHFLDVVNSAKDTDALIITGMRDKAPIAYFSHLIPSCKLLEICVKTSEEKHWTLGEYRHEETKINGDNLVNATQTEGMSHSVSLDNCPSLVFYNDAPGKEAATNFAERYLLPSFHSDLERLAGLVRRVPNFPRRSIEFCHVLDIAQQPGGLALSASLLRSQFMGNWTAVDKLVCCEAGGFIFASALATEVNIPLALVRIAGKLPPPVISAVKSPSHVSSMTSDNSQETRIEMDRDALPRGGSVVVIDDVLASGETLHGVLKLLLEAGIKLGDISVMVVAEFPVHRGRELLYTRGFGGVSVQSLLVFNGA